MADSETGPVDRRRFLKGLAAGAAASASSGTMHAQEHDHDHDHQDVPSDLTLRVKALESLLVEKGLVDLATLDAIVDTMEHKVGPRNGARVVARAWVDSEYKKRLLENAPAALAELGFTSGQGEHMVVVENGPEVHHLIVCTLCSCYPWPVLGLPPVWYKSAPYRSRASSILGASCASSGPRWPKTSRCTCGTARRSSATSSFPSVPRERRT